MQAYVFACVKKLSEHLVSQATFNRLINLLLGNEVSFDRITIEIKSYIRKNIHEQNFGIPGLAYPDNRHDFLVHLTRYVLKENWTKMVEYLHDDLYPKKYRGMSSPPLILEDPPPIPCKTTLVSQSEVSDIKSEKGTIMATKFYETKSFVNGQDIAVYDQAAIFAAIKAEEGRIAGLKAISSQPAALKQAIINAETDLASLISYMDAQVSK